MRKLNLGIENDLVAIWTSIPLIYLNVPRYFLKSDFLTGLLVEKFLQTIVDMNVTVGACAISLRLSYQMA